MPSDPAGDPLLELAEVHLSGRFSCTAAPVQAEGSVEGRPFYFRSRWDEWTFAIANAPEADPVDICDSSQGFFRSGIVAGGRYAASYLPLPDATEIIRRCAAEYLGLKR